MHNSVVYLQNDKHCLINQGAKSQTGEIKIHVTVALILISEIKVCAV